MSSKAASTEITTSVASVDHLKSRNKKFKLPASFSLFSFKQVVTALLKEPTKDSNSSANSILVGSYDHSALQLV